MFAARLPAVLNRLVPDAATDEELLGRYVDAKDDAAFAELMRRHRRMVANVCHRVLNHDADADDATQATFLVLVRRAWAIQDRTGLAHWLFGVARNVALKVRQMRTRRRKKEAETPPRDAGAAASDFTELLHAELAMLPAPSRAVIVLCDLEGRTITDAARELVVPPGTVASRLARGRVMLAKRLSKFGLCVSGGLLATLLEESLTAAVPETAFDVSAISDRVHSLASEVIQAMFTNPKATKLTILAAGLLAAAAVALAQTPPPKAPPPIAPPVPATGPKREEDPRSGAGPKRFVGFFALSQAVVRWEKDGTLSVRVQAPVGRMLRLADAGGKRVSVSELSYPQLGPAIVDPEDVEVFDVAGKPLARDEWRKRFADETAVLYAVKGLHKPKEFREQFGDFLKDGALVLVVPQKVNDAFEPFSKLPPIQSFPQAFPGEAPRGDTTPPPNK